LWFSPDGQETQKVLYFKEFQVHVSDYYASDFLLKYLVRGAATHARYLPSFGLIKKPKLKNWGNATNIEISNENYFNDIILAQIRSRLTNSSLEA
jgi:hypothetical protein